MIRFRESGEVQPGLIMYWSGYFDLAELSLEILISRGGIDMEIWMPFYSEMRQLDGFRDLLRENGMLAYLRNNSWNDYCQPLPGGDDFECF